MAIHKSYVSVGLGYLMGCIVHVNKPWLTIILPTHDLIYFEGAHYFGRFGALRYICCTHIFLIISDTII